MERSKRCAIGQTVDINVLVMGVKPKEGTCIPLGVNQRYRGGLPVAELVACLYLFFCSKRIRYTAVHPETMLKTHATYEFCDWPQQTVPVFDSDWNRYTWYLFLVIADDVILEGLSDGTTLISLDVR